MSSTHRRAERRADDAYYTPLWCTQLLLQDIELPSGHWLEPGCGDGAIIRAVNEQHAPAAWTALDLNPWPTASHTLTPRDRFQQTDFLDWTPTQRFEVTISNPPFSLAMEFVQKSLLLSEHVVMLLRLNFLASAKRAEFMRSHPPDVYVLPNRPSFTGTGTDSIDYAWFHWPAGRRAAGKLQVLQPLPRSKRTH